MSSTEPETGDQGELEIADLPVTTGVASMTKTVEAPPSDEQETEVVHKTALKAMTINGHRYPVRRKIPARVTARLSEVMETAFAGTGLQGMDEEEQRAEIEGNPEKYENIWGTNATYLDLAEKVLSPGKDKDLFLQRVDGDCPDDEVIEIADVATELMRVISGRSDPKQ